MSKQARHVRRLVIFAIAMTGFGFALVPLYDVFCRVLGINGKTGPQAVYDSKMSVDKTRKVTIQFLATKNEKLPWSFYPMTKSMSVHPGERHSVAYFAKNNTNHEMTVQAVPSVAPNNAAVYLKKIACFCFNRQTVKGGEEVKMPLQFYLEPKLPKSVHTVTLSYTLFNTRRDAKPKAKPLVTKPS